jgi:hypothetical protein
MPQLSMEHLQATSAVKDQGLWDQNVYGGDELEYVKSKDND